MKKFDLHIHTVSTQSDAPFTFSMEKLKQYVKERQIDAIAITNHNIFDLAQYKTIVSELSDIVAFPGIEINIGQNVGHLIVIARPDDADEFSYKCKNVENEIKSEKDSIGIELFIKIFDKLNNLILIPHYDKKPFVDKNILAKLKDNISCGEVNSIKKFIYCQKDENALVPVYFSDFRAKEGVNIFPIRQTYFDIDEISFEAVKKCLMDKNKIALSEEEGHKKFFALPGLRLSTGLNVIIGERSSGKTYMLNEINKYFENVKYIRQFELLETEPKKAAKDFTDRIATKQSGIAKEYFEEFIKVIDDVKDISLEREDKKLEEFLTTLQKHASETERADMFSKCKFYTENNFEINDLDNIKNLIKAVDTILSTTQYLELIEKNVKRESLINLYYAFIDEFINEYQIVLKKKWINDVIGNIKQKLQSKTAATRVTEINFYSVQMNRMKVKKFEEIAHKLKEKRQIYHRDLGGFSIEVETVPFSSAGSLKSHHKSRSGFSEAFKYYEEPYKFLQKLKEIETLEDKAYYECFADVRYRILNQYGFEVSGGERAEFNLLQEINDAYQYDMLLVDEPESSFDNIFLKNKVNDMLKDISQKMPVIIVTHNSTIGASIRPDFLIHTKRVISEDKQHISYEIYYGHPTNRKLKSNEGKEIRNLQATMDCLEAGESAYEERGKEYEMLRD